MMIPVSNFILFLLLELDTNTTTMDSRVIRRIKTVQDHLITPAPEADVARAETAGQEYGQTLNAEMQTMADERKKSTFNVREMTYFLDEGRKNTEMKERIALQIERDPVLLKKRFFDYSLEEDRARTMASVRRSVAVRKQLRDPALTRVFGELMGKYDRAFTMRTYVHDILFNETIWAQGTAEQYKEWEPLIKNYNVIGCFAMTEMGHSSFLRGLETTATFVKETDEFIIHSPTLTSTKWWIGMAGQTATHTVALCQLKVDENEHGLYWFIVPLRDRHTGELMPGVSAGHLGAKMGRGGLDNGWIQFSNVRVPRGNMLMKWAQVARDGTFTPPPNAAISYATLIGERILAMVSVHDQVGQCVTIATRYAAVRRQGARDEQVLDYQSHYSVLLPIIAGIYAVHFLRRTLEKDWQGKLAGSTEELLRVIQDYHAIAAGLKAWFGWWGADALEAIRRTLGGHGYSAYNAVAGHLADYGVITTGGGDNTILAQQCARYLLSSLQRAHQGKPLLDSVKYFGKWKELLGQKKFNVQRGEDLSNAENYLTALRWLSITMVGKAGERLASAMSSGQDPSDAWNNNLMELINCSKPHSVLYVVETFYRMIDTAQDASLKPVLKQLCDLFAMHYLKQFLVHFIEHGYMTADQAQLIRQYELTLCKQLRPNAVPLVDALGIPDWILKAPIGRYDGNIYENYFRTILESTTSDSVHGGTTPYWSKEVAPLTSPHRQ